VFRPVASYATVSHTMDGRRAGRPHRPHSARIARPRRRWRSPAPGSAQTSGSWIQAASPPVTGADLRRHGHQASRSVWFRHASGM